MLCSPSVFSFYSFSKSLPSQFANYMYTVYNGLNSENKKLNDPTFGAYAN